MAIKSIYSYWRVVSIAILLLNKASQRILARTTALCSIHSNPMWTDVD